MNRQLIKWGLGLSAVLAAFVAVMSLSGSAITPRLEQYDVCMRGHTIYAQDSQILRESPVLPSRQRLGFTEESQITHSVQVVQGRCLDLEERPVAGCSVRMEQRSSVGVDLLGAPVATGPSGTFKLELNETAFVFRLHIKHPEFIAISTEWSRATRERDVGDIFLTVGTEVRGWLKCRDGSPVPEVSVGLQRRGGHQAHETGPSHHRSISGPDGCVDLGRQLPGTYNVCIAGGLLVGGGEIVVPPGADKIEIPIVLERQATTESHGGRVVGPESTPIAYARVVVKDSNGHTYESLTDGVGVFSVVKNRSGRSRVVRVEALGEGYSPTAQDVDVPWNTSHMVLQIGSFVPSSVAVVTEDGSPVPSYTIRFRRVTGSTVAPLLASGEPWQEMCVENPDGVGSWSGFDEHTYEVRIEPANDQLSPTRIERVVVDKRSCVETVVITRRVSRKVAVVSISGMPVKGCSVDILEASAAGPAINSRITSLQEWPRLMTTDKCLAIMRAETDARGEVQIAGPAGRCLFARLTAPMCVPALIPIDDLGDRGPLLWTLALGGSVQFKFEPTEVCEGLPPSEGLLTLRLYPWRDGRRVGHAQVEFSVMARPSLRREVGVQAGAWLPVVTHDLGQSQLAPINVAEGAITPVVVDLLQFRVARLHGKLVGGLQDGAFAYSRVDVDRWMPGANGGSGRWVRSRAVTDAAGYFKADMLPGLCRVVYWTSGGVALVARPERFTLAPGAVLEQEFFIAAGSLEVTLVDEWGEPVLGAQTLDLIRQASGEYVTAGLSVDQEGRIILREVEVGSMILRILPRRLATPAAQDSAKKLTGDFGYVERERLVLASIEIVPGRTTKQRVVVPAKYFE